jgi:hypothetical protein
MASLPDDNKNNNNDPDDYADVHSATKDTGNNNESEVKEDHIVQSIYDHLVTSVCIDVASNLHELIKTGEIPISELSEPGSSRQDIFPDLYKDKDPKEIQAMLDQYATELPTRSSASRKRKFSRQTATNAEDDDDDYEEEEPPPEEPPTTTPSVQTRQTIHHLDIWGRMPPKEPKQTCECQLCGRHVSTTRFASHLDKCMGLSTRAPSTATGSSAQRNM